MVQLGVDEIEHGTRWGGAGEVRQIHCWMDQPSRHLEMVLPVVPEWNHLHLLLLLVGHNASDAGRWVSYFRSTEV